MPIRSGIGFGEAQVYNTGLPGAYAKTLQSQYIQQQKEHLKLADDMTSLLAKYSTKGLRDGDIKLVGDKYQQVKDLAAKALTTTNATERAQAMLDVKSGMQSIAEYADGALNAYKTLNEINPDIANNPWKYQDGVSDVVKKLYELPYAQWGNYASLNQSTFQRKPDNTAVYNLVDDVSKDLEKTVKNKPQFLKTSTVNGRIYETYNATPQQAADSFLARLQVNPKAKFTLDSMYREANPNKTDYTDLDLAKFATDNLYSKKPDAYSFAGGAYQVPKVAETAEEKAAKNLGNYDLTTDKVFISQDVYGEDPVTKKTVKIANGKPAIKFETFVPSPVNTPFDVSQVANVFNISDRKKQRLDSTAGLKMTGLGYSNGTLNATVVDKDGTEYSMNPRDVPASIRNGKQYQTALRKLNGEVSQPKQQVTTQSNSAPKNSGTFKSKSGITFTVK